MIRKGRYRADKLISMPIFTCLLFIFILGSAKILGSEGTLILALSGFIILAFILSGIRLESEDSRDMPESIVTRIGPFIIMHSHHSEELCEKGKEFGFKGKKFCTGCYGLFSGTMLSIGIVIFYLVKGLNSNLIQFILISLPFCLIPIILRYVLFFRMKTLLRFFSNMLLPIGISLLMILLDDTYRSWILNGIMIIIIWLIASLRRRMAIIDNNRLLNNV